MWTRSRTTRRVLRLSLASGGFGDPAEATCSGPTGPGPVCLSGRLPADVDEVARRRRRLAWGVAFEVSVDLVLQVPMKGLRHQLGEALQAVGVVGEAEFTGEDKESIREGEERLMSRLTQRGGGQQG